MTERVTAVANRWTRIVKETFFLKDRQGEYLVVERNPAIMIIPIAYEDGRPYTYLVKQFRYPINKEVWQFPMGTLDEDTDPLLHAKKELQEETGLMCRQAVQVGDYFVDPGLSRQKCLVFIAEGLTEGEQHLEETEEGMDAVKFPVSELGKMIRRGDIVDSWGFAGLYFINEYLRSKQP